MFDPVPVERNEAQDRRRSCTGKFVKVEVPQYLTAAKSYARAANSSSSEAPDDHTTREVKLCSGVQFLEFKMDRLLTEINWSEQKFERSGPVCDREKQSS